MFGIFNYSPAPTRIFLPLLNLGSLMGRIMTTITTDATTAQAKEFLNEVAYALITWTE
jgi:hypothetical protein